MDLLIDLIEARQGLYEMLEIACRALFTLTA